MSEGPRTLFASDKELEPRMRLPLIPPNVVNYRKPIPKCRRVGFRYGRNRGCNNEAVPYPQPSDGLQLKGLLVDSQVFLYDTLKYRVLRCQRGFFGEFVKHWSPDDISGQSEDEDLEDVDNAFPPSPETQPVAVLNLYEAYFLSLVGNCLEIWDGLSGARLNVGELMRVFTSIRPLFPIFFAVFYRFRMLNYVVASGVKFGSDFVLYEYGPLKTHSVYMAYVVIPGVRDPKLGMIDTLQRVANSAKKDALLVLVDSNELSPEELKAPDSFSRFLITEIISRRRERIYDKPVLEEPAPYVPVFPSFIPNSSDVSLSTPQQNIAGISRCGTRRPRRNTFQFHTVFMGIRRVFRGKQWALPGAVRSTFRAPIPLAVRNRAPMFISRNSCGYRPYRIPGRGARRNWRPE